MAEDNKTCARLQVHEGPDDSTVRRTLFVKSVWEPTKASPTSFSLAITDGCQAWSFEGSEAYVKERAEIWDKKASWVMEKLKFYLTLEQPGVTYRFTKTRDNFRKLSFEIQDYETNLSLTANFSLLDAPSETVTSDLLGFLLHGNEKLAVNYVEKCQAYDKMSAAYKVLDERFTHLANENIQSQKKDIQKFVELLNSKKLKCRELRKENARLTEQLGAKEDIEKNETTSSSSDDDEEEIDHQQLLPEKRMQIGEGSGKRLVIQDAAINADLDATQPFIDLLEIEPSTEDLLETQWQPWVRTHPTLVYKENGAELDVFPIQLHKSTFSSSIYTTCKEKTQDDMMSRFGELEIAKSKNKTLMKSR